jgi:hypothetical protein
MDALSNFGRSNLELSRPHSSFRILQIQTQLSAWGSMFFSAYNEDNFHLLRVLILGKE